MLRRLELRQVGPAARMTMDDVGPRFNLIAGDNGLGKSFLLELAWWALTRTWHEHPAMPNGQKAEISFVFDGDKKLHSDKGVWNAKAQTWRRTAGRPPNPGLVIYARVDGSFSVWDPARNYRLYQRADGGINESPAAYQFNASGVLEGIKRRVVETGREVEQTLCRGLIEDWVLWQLSGDPRFRLLEELLARIGPGSEPIRVGQPMQPSLDDVRSLPTIEMPYGRTIPITIAPAGVKRMAMLGYLLAWTLSEHEREATRIGQPVSKQMIILVDEPETHLHPRWQRTILPALRDAIHSWAPDNNVDIQVIAATHSPLVLASLESEFDPEQDRVWMLDFDAERQDVVLSNYAWRRQGDASRWLTSEVFDLAHATSQEVENAMQQAAQVVDNAADADDEAVRHADQLLGRLLDPSDPYIFRWRAVMRDRLGQLGLL
jgi:hypothetical protein